MHVLTAVALATSLFVAPSQGEPKLEIKDLKVGKGREAVKGDILTVLYTGKLTNGKVFDSSDKKPPFVFTVGAEQVIAGWDKGVLGMKVGGKRALTVPPTMGYGDQDLGDIPPSSTLKFEIELLRIDRRGDEAKIETTITKKGEGSEVAAEGDTVGVHYRGMFLNGVPFDNSYDRNEPLAVTIGTTGLIKGFTQGLIGMKLKEKRRVVIPATLGYGDRPRGPIAPNSTLVFELELVRLTKKVTQ